MSFFFLVFSLNAVSQHCYCPANPRKNLYTYTFSGDTLKLCGLEYDAYNNDKIIGSFVLSQCSVDSLLIDTFHDEGGSYLFQKNNTGFNIIMLELTKENGKFEYPKEFEQIGVRVANKKVSLTHSNIQAGPIIKYLEKNFKKLSELY